MLLASANIMKLPTYPADLYSWLRFALEVCTKITRHFKVPETTPRLTYDYYGLTEVKAQFSVSMNFDHVWVRRTGHIIVAGLMSVSRKHECNL
eukprot:g20708.t1